MQLELTSEFCRTAFIFPKVIHLTDTVGWSLPNTKNLPGRKLVCLVVRYTKQFAEQMQI